VPNGKTHNFLHKVGVPLALAGGVAYAQSQGFYGGVAFVWGYLSGAVIEPDLDLPGRTYSEYIISKYLGPLAWPWLTWWWFYAKIIGGHRSKLSHLPLISTFIRMLWVWLPLGALAFYTNTRVWGWWLHLTDYFVPVFWGLSLSDTIHIIADAIYSALGLGRRW
jgi:uncharacterized metal-binding protein